MSERVWSGAALLILGVAVTITLAAAQTSVPSSDERTLRIIVVESAVEAERVRERLLAGDRFDTLATQLSVDPSANRGGMLGRLQIAALRPELRAAVQTLGVGQISAVVPVPTGFAVLKVVPDEEAGAGDTLVTPTNRAISAAGSVKPTLDVSGFAMAVVALQEFDKPADWNQDPGTICDLRTRSVAAAEADVARDVATLGQPGARLAPNDVV